MITNLRINNFTLIDSLDITLQRGFSVITGETGAGKSIILGALSILLGHRADSKSVKMGTQRCTVEAHFDINGYGLEAFFEEYDIDYDADDCILRRELTAAGKSRAFINDTPVQLTVLRELGEKLVDIHSQHQNLLLRDSDFQLSVVDIIAKDKKELEEYHAAYGTYLEAKKKLSKLQDSMNQNREQEDFLRYQLQELEDAALSDINEQTELEALSESMNHSEEIKEALYKADNLLNNDNTGIVQQLRQTCNAIQGISTLFRQVEEVSERLDSAYIELKDIAAELSSTFESIDFDPQEQERINARLDQLYTLEKKHRCDSVAELIAIRDTMREKLSAIDNSDEMIREQEVLVGKAKEKVDILAERLTKLRQKAAKTVEKDMKQRLVPLGIPKVQFVVDIKEHELNESGKDLVTYLFSANTSTAMQPVAQVASGGEIARVMLSLKAMISNAVSLPTIIFDEIDTGVSGKIAEAMANIMKEMGENGRQVISITHLPQIASKGSVQYQVQKTEESTGTQTNMKQLSEDERIDEIAQMLSGSNITDTARQQAKELLES